MIIIKEHLDKPYIEQVKRYLYEDALFLDIETLGLSSEYYPIYLIGTICWEDGELFLRQYMASDISKEEALLKEAFKDTSHFKKIITFNGEGFDIPYIKKRALKYNLSSPYSKMESLDLYKVSKRQKKRLNLSHCNQTSIECFLGLNRTDEYDGGKLIPIYKEYANNKDKNLEHILLLHNYEDIKGMIRILSMLFYDKLPSIDIDITDIDCSDKSELIFNANLSDEFPRPHRLLSEHYHIVMENHKLSGVLHPVFTELKHFLSDTKSYYYLPDEDIIIPKQLGDSIPRERRKKATKANCAVKKSGYFLPLPIDIKSKVLKEIADSIRLFKKDYKEKAFYIYLPIDESEKSSKGKYDPYSSTSQQSAQADIYISPALRYKKQAPQYEELAKAIKTYLRILFIKEG